LISTSNPFDRANILGVAKRGCHATPPACARPATVAGQPRANWLTWHPLLCQPAWRDRAEYRGRAQPPFLLPRFLPSSLLPPSLSLNHFVLPPSPSSHVFLRLNLVVAPKLLHLQGKVIILYFVFARWIQILGLVAGVWRKKLFGKGCNLLYFDMCMF
jgi:hypothetical protein